MNTVFKIRLLLLVLALSFIGTAVTINLTYTKDELLFHEGKQLAENLHKKEKLVFDFIQDSANHTSLQNIAYDTGFAEYVIDYFVEKHNIYIVIYQNNELAFWTSDKFVPQTDAGIHNGTTIIKTDNGWYEAIKQTFGTSSVVFLIPIKSAYQKSNDYLQNTFAEELIGTNNLTIADYEDEPVFNIRSIEGDYLFSVKVLDTPHITPHAKFELAMWLLAAFCITVLVNILCLRIAKKGWIWTSILMFAGFLILTRYADLYNGWISSHFYMGIFDPRYFASNFIFPHLGGFLLNVAAFTWFVGYVYAFREELDIPYLGRTSYGSVFLVLLFGALVYLVAHFISLAFSGLISNSDINFDLTNLLGLTVYSWLGIFALWLSMLSLLLLVDLLVVMSRKLIPDLRHLLIIQGVVILCLLVFRISTGELFLSFLLLSALIVLRTWYSNFKGRSDFAVFISTLLLLAGISATEHGQFQQSKRQEAQKFTIQKLVATEDVDAEALFFDLEKEIVHDPFLIEYFRNPQESSRETMEEHLKKTYLSGYLSKYEFQASEYDVDLVPLGSNSTSRLIEYRDKVISGAIKVSDNLNFYRGKRSFGNFEYFAQLPILDEENQLGVLLIELTNRSFSQRRPYPDILTDGRVDRQHADLISRYSYAFYQDGHLISQYGKHVYPVTDEFYPGEERKYIPLGQRDGFSHVMYRPNSQTLAVLSEPQQSHWMQLAALSFLFLVFLIFSLVSYTIQWIIITLNNNGFSLRNLKWSLMIFRNRVLYSTRIQTFMVFTVVFTLIIAGVITYISISWQFQIQQEMNALKHVNDIAKGMETRMIRNARITPGTYTDENFNAIAESMATDLNLFNTNGELIYSTQPRIFDLRLVSKHMDAKAYLHLDRYRRTEFISKKSIGKLNYFAAYAPIRDEKYDAIAYLSLPHYAAQQEFDENIGMLLNALINIYALVILALGLFAVFVANKITAPLMLVQRSLAKTTIGNQNEPIFWKRNDEIGSLIREYNLMIVALEQSANKIVRSERESAWREMAKQVAHEIKNPLTPLKLGIQHLERSWKEKDPRFDEKFKRFSKSFIEQIESLSHIASEFSTFAKMPDTKLEKVDIYDILNKAIEVFRNNTGVNISLNRLGTEEEIVVKGDRDQLLRSFNNLIKNSIEACTNKRKCRIEVVVGYDENDNVLISIKDNGEGISPEITEKLFQPNFTTKSSGTGLGLAFVKQAVEGMGGNVSYETTVGRGTVFYLTIPPEGYQKPVKQ